ncbi:MAG: ferredoxin--NADP reductase [Phycisphaerae bacterium]|jgi:ferredoxin--NADP+ reductase
MSAPILNAAVVQRHDLNEFLSIVRIRPHSGVIPPFEPGQFLMLGLPRNAETSNASPAVSVSPVRWVRRAYSIASASGGVDHFEFFLARIERGRLTSQLWALDVGDELWADDRARGDFTLARVPPGADVVMVCTGTGLAPFMSMLRSRRSAGVWRRTVLIHGVRQVSDLGYRDELERLAREDATFHYIPVVSRAAPDGPWNGLRGRVQSALTPQFLESRAGVSLSPDRCHVMLCGNPAMIRDVEMLLAPLGFRAHTTREAGNLHYERYW